MQPVRTINRLRLRSIENSGRERHASWLELFFDLVFVFAVSRVAYSFSHDLSAVGTAHYFAVFAFVWWAWVGYAFYANRFESEETIYRLLMFAGMLGVAALAMSVRGAFTPEGATGFTLSYVAVRAVLIILYARAAYYVPLAREFCVRNIIGFSFGAGLWLASLLFPAPARYWLWAAGFATELFTPFLNNRIINRTPFDTSHIPERFGLFTIIVLGEAVVGAAMGASQVEWRMATVLTAALGFGVAAALWWIHFEFVEDYALRRGGVWARYLYMYGHYVMVAGIVATGIGVEHAIEEAASGEHLSLPTRSAMMGGVTLFLVAITAIRLASQICHLIWTRTIAIAIAVALLVIGGWLSPLAVVCVLLLALAAEVWMESRYDETSEPEESIAGPPLRCEHVKEARVLVVPKTNGCEECLKGKQKWVHLRLCLACGHVGCCDSSENKHASRHFRETEHPVMKSIEPGEDWAWCYVDEMFVTLNAQSNPRAEDSPELQLT
jgi:low temperature requirement protein LtrA